MNVMDEYDKRLACRQYSQSGMANGKTSRTHIRQGKKAQSISQEHLLFEHK
jgi:hypothetical protein